MTAAKLTLRMDDELIRQAKSLAKERNVSVSRLVADYFAALSRTATHRHGMDRPLPPITASLHGIAAGGNLDEKDYYRYLEDKYL